MNKETQEWKGAVLRVSSRSPAASAASQDKLPGEKQRDLVQESIDFWNKTDVNPHPRLGVSTKERIRKALLDALEEYSWEELLNTINVYVKVYKTKHDIHKYRLVEFLEKRGYEHFTAGENWQFRRDAIEERSYEASLFPRKSGKGLSFCEMIKLNLN